MVLFLKATIVDQPQTATPSDPFEVSFLNPCESSSISLVETIPTLSASVFGPLDSFIFEATDSISTDFEQNKGLAPHLCGEFEYEVFELADSSQEHTKLSTSDERTIEVQTDDASYLGGHDMILRVTLVDHGISEDFPFDVEIDACIIESLSFDGGIEPQTYKLGNDKQISVPDVIQTPACEDVVSITVSGEPELPAGLLTVDSTSNLLVVFADQEDDLGDYDVTVIATVINSLGDEVTEEIIFRLMVLPADSVCEEDVLTIVTAPVAFSSYMINFLEPTIGDGSVDYLFEVH